MEVFIAPAGSYWQRLGGGEGLDAVGSEPDKSGYYERCE